MKTDTDSMIIQGKVERFSLYPRGQQLRLMDGDVVWTLDTLLNDFENDRVCVTVKRIKQKNRKGKK